MNSNPVIATWMYSPPATDSSLHHQVGANIGTQKVRNYYWRSTIVLLASATLYHPDSPRILLVNEMPPFEIDGFEITPILKRFGIQIKKLSHITRPPTGYHGAWNTQFIVLDALQELASIADSSQPVILLDSDCVFIRSIPDSILERVNTFGILRYDLGNSDDTKENGLSNKDLASLAAEYEPPLEREVIRYAGGEFFCGRADLLDQVITIGRKAYHESLRRHTEGLPKFNEEAHLLSYVYEVLGSPDASANDVIKRIWTDRGCFSNVDGSESGLTIWHLPAEKKSGIINAFRAIASGESFPENIETCSRLFHIKTSPAELFMMHTKGVLRKIRNAARKFGGY
jgi:hypothetical protein